MKKEKTKLLTLKEFEKRFGTKRQIKFKAWNVESQYMWNMVAQIDFIGEYIQVCQPSPDNHFMVTSLDMQQVKLLEFTQMKDKNGINIYEGDIIYIDNLPGRTGFGKAVVTHHGAGFSYYIYGKYQGWLGELICKHCEVIGNIYEHYSTLDQSI